jgi:hypothetical protein
MRKRLRTVNGQKTVENGVLRQLISEQTNRHFLLSQVNKNKYGSMGKCNRY